MMFYSEPPPARTFRQNKPTLLVAWWCTLFAAVIILFRVAGRYVRSERLFREDRLAFACLIPLFARMAFVHVVLLYGTNNVQLDSLDKLSIEHRAIGSRLVIGSRFFYAATLWMLKFTITEFLKRLTIRIWRHSYEVTLLAIRWTLVLTFLATFLSDLLECHPTTHYWQVSPDPGPHCRQGYGQLLTLGICNILTDLSLVIFPIPIIINSSMPLKRKFHLICLFALSIIPIIITLYRIPHIIERKGNQQQRSLWASIEILAATAVANALVLGSFVRDRGVKKQKWKVGSMSESMERSISVRGTVARAWGSDEDLVRDLGLGVDLELRHHRHVSTIPRPAPKATSGNETSDTRYPRDQSTTRPKRSISKKRDWNDDRPDAGNASDDYDLLREGRRRSDDSGGLESMITPRKVSFFDVGGLLEDGNDRDISPRTTTTTTVPNTPAFTFSPIPHNHMKRSGSAALLHDLGGLLSPLGATDRNGESNLNDSTRTRPGITRSATSWTHQSSFGFSSFDRHSRRGVAREGDADADTDIPMRILHSGREEERSRDRDEHRTGELRDVGGLLD